MENSEHGEKDDTTKNVINTLWNIFSSSRLKFKKNKEMK